MAATPVVAVVALAVVFLVAGGLGYACSAGTLSDKNSGATSSIELSWANPIATSPSPSYVGCSSSYTSEVLSLHVTNLAPGASCTLSATIKNSGSLPATLYAEITLSHPVNCLLFTYSDNVAKLSKAPVVDPGHPFSYHAVFSLAASAGNACEEKLATVTVTISSTYSCETSAAQWDPARVLPQQ